MKQWYDGYHTREEIFSAMVVYGFLSYEDGKVCIPNKELMNRFADMLRRYKGAFMQSGMDTGKNSCGLSGHSCMALSHSRLGKDRLAEIYRVLDDLKTCVIYWIVLEFLMCYTEEIRK